MKKIRMLGLLILALAVLAFAWFAFSGSSQEPSKAKQRKENALVIAGPFASVSHPVARIIETNALSDIADEVILKQWKNPDELRATIMQNGADFIAVPTNVAANLYNKGTNLKLLNVSVWGILGMISRDSSMKTLSDFKGKKVVVPFRSDMPDIVFRTILKKQGVDPQKDIEIYYSPSPLTAMRMLIMRRVDHALLAEPAISMALRKTKSFPISVLAPDLYRSVNLQKDWGTAFKREGRIPQAGMAALNQQDENVTKRFLEEYDKALQWYLQNPKEAGELTHKYFPMLDAQAVTDSISHVQIDSISAKEAKKEIEFFFNILKADDPKSIGGKLPADGFYN